MQMRTLTTLILAALVLLAVAPTEALAHDVTKGDKGYIQAIAGVALMACQLVGYFNASV